MPRAHPCDCCGQPRLKWQRLCDSCFRALPATIRTALLSAWKRGDKPVWREARKAAREFFASRAHAHVRACSGTTSAEEAYARTAAILGERE